MIISIRFKNILHLSLQTLKASTQILLEFSVSWQDKREAEHIIAEIKNARKKSISKIVKGFNS
jgi:hypothetical protein